MHTAPRRLRLGAGASTAFTGGTRRWKLTRSWQSRQLLTMFLMDCESSRATVSLPSFESACLRANAASKQKSCN
jgi:hypothetical protein